MFFRFIERRNGIKIQIFTLFRPAAFMYKNNLSITRYILVFVLASGFASCKKQPAQQQNTLPTATLKTTAPFPMGSAVGSYPLQNSYVYQGTLLGEYNSLTADWEMKFNEVEPQQGQFNYTPGD